MILNAGEACELTKDGERAVVERYRESIELTVAGWLEQIEIEIRLACKNLKREVKCGWTFVHVPEEHPGQRQLCRDEICKRITDVLMGLGYVVAECSFTVGVTVIHVSGPPTGKDHLLVKVQW